MQVILLEKIDNLGGLGDLVDVKSGFARNYLFPQAKAEPATTTNIEAFKQRREELEQAERNSLAAAEARKATLDGMTLTLSSKAGTEGKLFGSIGNEEIRAAIVEAGTPLEKKEIRMPDGPLRALGEHEVQLHLHADVDAMVTIVIVPEEN